MKKRKTEKRHGVYFLRDWLFERMIDFLVFGDFEVKISDFKNSADPYKRDLCGLTDYGRKIIFLDAERGTSKILVHELGHVFFNKAIEVPARSAIGSKEGALGWGEERINEFEDYFYASLTKKQKTILQNFIDEIKKRRA